VDYRPIQFFGRYYTNGYLSIILEKSNKQKGKKMTVMSDEVKLQHIKQDLADVIVTVKTMMTTYTAMSAQAMLFSDELEDGPEKEYLKSEEYQKLYCLASKANTELFANLINQVDKIATNFGMEFIDSLPRNQEELAALQKEILKGYETE